MFPLSSQAWYTSGSLLNRASWARSLRDGVRLESLQCAALGRERPGCIILTDGMIFSDLHLGGHEVSQSSVDSRTHVHI